MMLWANIPCLNTTGFNWDVHADTGNGDSVAAGRTAQTSTYKALKNKSKTTNKLQRPLEVEWICVLKQFLHHATDHSKMLLTPTLFGKWETRRKKKKKKSQLQTVYAKVYSEAPSRHPAVQDPIC